jgi:hypothetical protein
MDKESAAKFVMQQEQAFEPQFQGGLGAYYVLLCSRCFLDEGLRLTSESFGIETNIACPNCGQTDGLKFDLPRLRYLVQLFFTVGTMHRADFGAAPVLVSNEHQKNGVSLPPWSAPDLELLSKKTGLGVFLYGPRLWMVGENYPLKSLMQKEEKSSIIRRIVTEFPVVNLDVSERFYRMRVNPSESKSFAEYDSPPDRFCGAGRLDSPDFPILYGSQDMQVCVHECRTTVDDEAFVATLSPTRELKLLDLTHILREENVTEFESLDMAVHMLFLARSHAYPITREIARVAKEAGFDGVIYPSYFSLLRTGSRPFETIYGMSIRRIPDLEKYATGQIIANLALFGRPISEGLLKVNSLNRVIMSKAHYTLTFGPVGFENTWSPT